MIGKLLKTTGQIILAGFVYNSARQRPEDLPEHMRGASDEELARASLEAVGLTPFRPAPPPPSPSTIWSAPPLPRSRRKSSELRRRRYPFIARALPAPAPAPVVKSLGVRFCECFTELHQQFPKARLKDAIEFVRPVARSIFNPPSVKNVRAGRPAKIDFAAPEHAPNVEAVMRRWFAALAKRLGLDSVPDDVRLLFKDPAHVGRGWWGQEIRALYPQAGGDFVEAFRRAVYQLKSSLL